MTNKDKFLQKGVSVEEFAKEFEEFCVMMKEENIVMTYKQEMEEFLNCKIQPTLTEDERVILKNIDTDYYPTIKKINKTLYIVDKEDMYKEIEYMFKDHIFQFIKEGEEYSIEELINNE